MLKKLIATLLKKGHKFFIVIVNSPRYLLMIIVTMYSLLFFIIPECYDAKEYIISGVKTNISRGIFGYKFSQRKGYTPTLIYDNKEHEFTCSSIISNRDTCMNLSMQLDVDSCAGKEGVIEWFEIKQKPFFLKHKRVSAS